MATNAIVLQTPFLAPGKSLFRSAVEAAKGRLSSSLDVVREKVRLLGRWLCLWRRMSSNHSTSRGNLLVGAMKLVYYHPSLPCKAVAVFGLVVKAVVKYVHNGSWHLRCIDPNQLLPCSIRCGIVNELSVRHSVVRSHVIHFCWWTERHSSAPLERCLALYMMVVCPSSIHVPSSHLWAGSSDCSLNRLSYEYIHISIRLICRPSHASFRGLSMTSTSRIISIWGFSDFHTVVLWFEDDIGTLGLLPLSTSDSSSFIQVMSSRQFMRSRSRWTVPRCRKKV